MAVDDLEFREFFASHYARLCWLGYLLASDRAEAEELAQDALVRTYKPLGPGASAQRPGRLRPPGAGQPAPLAAAPSAAGSAVPAAKPRPADLSARLW
jgi:hypothetical protein